MSAIIKINPDSLGRVLFLLGALLAPVSASAQMMGPMGAGPMSPMAPGPMGPPSGGASSWPSNPPPCVGGFLKLRSEVEKAGLAAKAAREHKASREDMCKLITTFVAAEAKMVGYAAANASACGIPPQAIKQMQEGHVKTTAVRTQICTGPAPAAPPTLSDALGTSSFAIDSIKAKSNTFNTLTGNPLKQ
jgi:hypothetical protein